MRAIGLAAAVAAVALGGCERERAIAGVDTWNVTRTRLRDANGRCQPETLPGDRAGTYCFLNAPMRVRGMGVEIDLYFDGVDPDAPLAKILMKVGACDADKLTAWLQTTFGAAAERRGDRRRWQNRHLRVIGELPMASQPQSCLVHLLRADEQAWADQTWAPPGS